MNGSPIFRELLCVSSSSRDDECVKQGASLTFVVMVGEQTFANADFLPCRVDVTTPWSDNPGGGTPCFERSPQTLHLGKIESIP